MRCSRIANISISYLCPVVLLNETPLICFHKQTSPVLSHKSGIEFVLIGTSNFGPLVSGLIILFLPLNIWRVFFFRHSPFKYCSQNDKTHFSWDHCKWRSLFLFFLIFWFIWNEILRLKMVPPCVCGQWGPFSVALCARSRLPSYPKIHSNARHFLKVH